STERERGGQQMGPRGPKRREKNRDAARKSRRKQTERADELHEELQSLEHSNSALHKEIAALKKELHLLTTSLERHEPYCLVLSLPCNFTESAKVNNTSLLTFFFFLFMYLNLN
uniref:Basic leucine zipper ATF-like transcription factor 2 n=1 Tax=Astatotilapia calliptera TaxID=8154 RepID=A0A3P8QPB9_ASTCA